MEIKYLKLTSQMQTEASCQSQVMQISVQINLFARSDIKHVNFGEGLCVTGRPSRTTWEGCSKGNNAEYVIIGTPVSAECRASYLARTCTLLEQPVINVYSGL